MKTQVIMKRQLWDYEISQQSKTEFLSATDLVKAGNAWRVNNGLPFFNFNEWLRLKNTKIFIEALKTKYGQVKVNSRGKNSHTWVHPLLFMDIALAISPDLKIKVYEWLYDSLLKYRNDSGNSYKLMTGALHGIIPNKSNFEKNIKKIANTIREETGVRDWQRATEKQLQHRDKIQEYFSIYADLIRDVDLVLKAAITQAKKYMLKQEA